MRDLIRSARGLYTSLSLSSKSSMCVLYLQFITVRCVCFLCGSCGVVVVVVYLETPRDCGGGWLCCNAVYCVW